MASEIAKEIAKTVTMSNYERALLHRGSIRTQDVEICEAVDVELAEVREVLDALQSLGQKNCWCRFTNNKEHSITCRRTRALYEKLRTDK